MHELNASEIIATTSNIANALVNITASTQEPLFAQDIDLAVKIISILNKYESFQLNSIYCINLLLNVLSVTKAVVTSLTINDTFFEVRIKSHSYNYNIKLLVIPYRISYQL